MQKFEFKKSVDEMTEGELRATLREFTERQNEQIEAAEALEAEAAEYKADAEEAREELQSAQSFFGSIAADLKDMDEEVMADRFSLDELVEIVDASGQFSLDVEADEADDEGDDEEAEGEDFSESDGDEGSEAEQSTKFAEREQKSREAPDTSYTQDRARETLESLGLVINN